MPTKEITVAELRNGDIFVAPDGQRRTFDSFIREYDDSIELLVTSGATFGCKKADKVTIRSTYERGSNDPWV
jgi:hypothetical protein